jgi:uncharacterized protein (TIGR03067 family)
MYSICPSDDPSTGGISMKRIPLIAVLAVLLAGADEPKELDAELKRFEGTWTIQSLKVDGNDLPPSATADTRLVIEAGGAYTHTEGGVTTHGTFKLDPSADPRTIDITFTDGPQKGGKIEGIYKLKDDTYTLCFALDNKPRPKEFSSKPDTGLVLEVFKREKQ